MCWVSDETFSCLSGSEDAIQTEAQVEGKKKLMEKWVRCTKENGPHVFLNETSRLSGVRLADATHKSIDGSPSGSVHLNARSGYVALLLLISCWSAEPWAQHLSTFPWKTKPQPENELLIVAPVGRASPDNVCKQINVPTVSADKQTHICQLGRRSSDSEAELLPLLLLLFILDCFLWDCVFFFLTCILLCQRLHL